MRLLGRRAGEPRTGRRARTSSDPPSQRSGPAPERALRRRWLWRAAAAWGLTALGLSIPLFLVLGPAPEFFVAHDAGPGEVVAFAVVVGVLAPLLVAALAAAADLLGPSGRSLVLAPFALVAVASLVQGVSLAVLWVPLCLVGAAGLLVFEPREPVVRAALAVAAVAGLVVTAWFVGPSRTGAYVRASDAAELSAAVADAGADTPVVVITLDELPLHALLTSDLAVNAERYPTFARLAATSHWYRQAASVSGQTAYSVPAIWSGTDPVVGGLPVASEHPTNLFLQLGARYQGHALEPITALCPSEVCGDGGGPAPRSGAGAPSLVDDALVVLGHTVGGPLLADRLPSISEGWAGFGADDWTVEAGDDAAIEGGIGGYAQQVASATEWAESCRPEGDAPPLCVGHVILPHGAWRANLDGGSYPAPAGDEAPGAEVQGRGLAWTGTEAQRAAGYQRMLLQLGATDLLLGRLVEQLEANGVWDEAIVVVVADHGISFDPGSLRDERLVEVSAVPLFIKEPGQQEGEQHDDAALTIDAAPTVLGLLGLDVPDAVDGVDLLGGGEVPDRREDASAVGAGGRHTPDQTPEALAEVVERRASWVEPDGDASRVYAVGADGYVGTATSEHEVDDEPAGTWRLAEGTASPSGNVAAVEVQADIELTQVVAARDDGVIVGSSLAPAEGETTVLTFAVAPTVTDDLGTLSFFGVDPSGALRPLTSPT